MTDERVTARSEIAQVLYRYCRGMDRMDADLTRRCFLTDAQLDYGTLFAGTAQEFIDWLWPVHAAMVGHTHSLSNILVEVDGERAASEAYVQTTLRCRDADEVFDLVSTGRYLDSWVRDSDAWRIARHCYLGDLATVRPVQMRDITHLFDPMQGKPVVRGRRDTGDASYVVLDLTGS